MADTHQWNVSLTIADVSDMTYLVEVDTDVLPLYHLSVVYLGIQEKANQPTKQTNKQTQQRPKKKKSKIKKKNSIALGYTLFDFHILDLIQWFGCNSVWLFQIVLSQHKQRHGC
jgi:hypothetical protein